MDTSHLTQLLKRIRLNMYFVFGAAMAIFAGLLVAVILLMPSQPEPESNGQLTSPPPMIVTELPAEVTYIDQDGQPVPSGLPVVYEVQAGDSTWKIAEAFYGSGFNYVDIEQANELAHNAQLSVGQQLTIPAMPVRSGQQVIAAASPVLIPSPSPVVSSPESTQAPSPTMLPSLEIQPTEISTPNAYTIQPGDSLWLIAEKELGDPYRWPELYQLNRAVIGHNPDLIYPGVELALPAIK